MSDARYDAYQHYGTNAERLAFVPDPPALSGVQPVYIWYETDTDDTYLYDTSWHQIATPGGGGSGITALTGDVTATGPGSAAATIANDAVTFAKMLNATTDQVVIGRNTAGSGNFEEVTVSQLLDWLGI